MKKLFFISLTLVIILTNVFIYSYVVQKQIFDFLYSEQTMTIEFESNVKLFGNQYFADFEEHLLGFSEKYDISISQYVFIDDNKLNIYSTKPINNLKIYINTGEYPSESQYISNEKREDVDQNQSGTFSFPISDWRVHIYKFNQIRNVGMRSTFYLSTKDTEVISKFSEEFSRYGKVLPANQNISELALFDKTLFMITLASYFIFSVISYLNIIQNRKEIIIHEIWGYANWRIIYLSIRSMLRWYGIMALILFAILIIGTVFLRQMNFLFMYIQVLLFTNVIVALILSCIMRFGSNLVRRMSDSSLKIKGKIPYKEIQKLSVGLKIIVSIVLFLTVVSALSNYNYLGNKLGGLEFWNQSKNVYRVKLGSIPEKQISDLRHNRDLNNRLFDFYQEIELVKGAFLIDSNNFARIPNNKTELTYFFTANATGDESIYSPYGKKVEINMNYLEVNPIDTIDGIEIRERIILNEDVLNLLVPLKYVMYEEEIIKAYKEYFHFVKVQVDNIYNEALGEQLNLKSVDDLQINIIYVQNEQAYFTFNTYTGNYNNQIIDPIAVIYNDSFDSSHIASLVSSSLYYQDYSGGRAFENVEQLVVDSNVSEIEYVESVYSEANNEIIRVKGLLIRQLIALLMALVGFITFQFIIIWAHYNSNIHQIVVKYLFGYSGIKRNYQLIVSMIAVNLIAGLIVFFLHRSYNILILMFISMSIDLLSIKYLGRYFCGKNINRVLKGEFI